ncbi:MAG: hypothetical protein ACI3XI_00820 [Eubacteriales bacterium]
MTKESLKSILPRLLLSVLLISVIVGFGIGFRGSIPEAYQEPLLAAFVICFIITVVCYIADLIARNIYVKKITTANDVRKQQDYILSRAENIRSDCLKARRKLRLMHALIAVYFAVMVIICAFLSLSVSLLPYSIIFLIPAICMLTLTVINVPLGTKKKIFADYTNREDYPLLHSLVEKAAQQVGVEGKVRIAFDSEGNIGVAKIGNVISIRIDPAMPIIMGEEELYVSFLHEMAHIMNTDTSVNKVYAFAEFLMGESKATSIPFLSFCGVILWYETDIYRLLASVVIEQLADRAMAEYGDKTVAANALFKLYCYGKFDDKLDYYMERHVYSGESIMPDLKESIANTFLAQMHEREAFWKELTKKEIQPRSASHPILRTRLETIGATDYCLTDPESEGAYREEALKGVRAYDAKLSEALAENYGEYRKKNYLEPLALVEDWEKRGKPCDIEEARFVLEALIQLNKFDEAIRFSEEIIEKHTGGIVINAKFIRGCIRLNRYDDRGIDDIYEAVENSTNYTERGLELIGNYCCETGLADRLEEYRERCIGLYQKEIDTAGWSTLDANDTLCAEDVLPENIAAYNIDYIKRVGEEYIEKVWLVRKKVTEDFWSSAYVIEFSKDAPDDKKSDIYDKVFHLLDNSPEDWDYSLFVYDEDIARAIAKVPNCCIYSKT